MRSLLASVSLLALMGCTSEPGSEMATRECLWVASASRYPAQFAGEDVAVCGWIERRDGVVQLTDEQKPQWRVALSFPATSGGDPGLERVLAALASGDARDRAIEARFHGRLRERPGSAPTLVVQRVDWLEGWPR